MDMPTIHQWDNPEYYKQVMPAELAQSHVWQLVYGEFRAPKYMAVMREFMRTFDWDNVKESDISKAVQLLSVWSKIPSTRMLEWPTMNEALYRFAARLTNKHFELVKQYMAVHTIDWIDNETVWYALVEEPYAALQL
jgi:hypothetical protein